MYNKRQFHKYDDKKVLHKVRKQWVVMSLSLLAILGAGGIVTTQTHAKAMSNPNPDGPQVKKNSNEAQYTLKPSVTNRNSRPQAANQLTAVNTRADNLYHQIMRHQAQQMHQIATGDQQNKGVVPQQTSQKPDNPQPFSQNGNNKITYDPKAVKSQDSQPNRTPTTPQSNGTKESNPAKAADSSQPNAVSASVDSIPKPNVANVADNDNNKNAEKKPSINLKSSNPNIITGNWGSAPFKFNNITGELTTTSHGEVEELGALPSSITNNVKSISFYGNTLYAPAENDFANLPNLQSIDLSNLDTRGVTNMNGMFSNDPKLQSITFGNHFDTSDVTDMSWMFGSDSNLRSINLSSNFNTSKVTNMSSMFCGDSRLQSVDFSQSNPDVGNVTNMSQMFYGDSNLYSIDFGNHFDTSNVNNMSTMFYADTNLKKISGINNFNTSNVNNMGFMFHGDSKISDLDLSGFDTRNSIGNMGDMLDDVAPNILIMGPETELSSSSNMSNLFYKKDSNDSYTSLTPQQIDTGTPEPGTYYSKMNPAPGANISGTWGTAPFQLTFKKENGTVKGTLETTGPGQIDGINNLSGSIPLQDVDDITFAPGTVAPTDSSDLLGGNTTTIYTSDGMAEQASSLANVSDINCTNLNTSNVTNMPYMFQNDTNLKKIEFGNKFDTSKVQSMAYMFTDDYHLGSVLVSDHEADHKLTVQPLLLDLSNFNTGQVEQMAGMFQNDYGLIELNLGNNFDTSNALTINDMFNGDHSLTTLDLGSKFDTSSVDGVNKEHTYITYSDGMNGMFANDYNLKSLNLGDKFNTSNVNSMSDMFANDANLTDLNLGNRFDTSNVKHMSNMFTGDTAIKALDLGDSFNTNNVSDMHDMFANDVNLQKLDLGNNFTTNKASSSTIQEYGQMKDPEGNQYTSDEGQHNGAQNVFQNDNSLNTVNGNFELKGSVDLPNVTGQSWYQQTASDQPTGLPLNIANGQPLNGTYGLYTSNQIVKTTLNFQDVNHGNQSIGHINIAGFSNTYIPDSVIANSLGAGYVPDISWTATINGVKMVQTFPNTPYEYISGTVNVPVKKDSNVSNGDSSSVLSQQNAMGNVKVTYLNGSDQNKGSANVSGSQLATLNTAAGMPGVNISQFLTTGFPASYKLKNSVNPIVVPTSDVTSDVNVPLAPNVGSLTVDYMNGDQQVDTQQISASDVAKWGQASGTPNVDITSSLKYPVSYKLQNQGNNITIPSLGNNSTVKVNVLPNVGKLNVTYDYDGQPVATQVINSDDLATLKTKGSDSFNVPDSMLSFPASYKLHSTTNSATMPNVGQTGNATVNLDLNVGNIAVKYMDNGTQKGQTQTISASDVAKQRVASGQNLNITSLLNKDYPASYKLQKANDNSVTVPTVCQTASDNVSIVPNVGSLSIKYIEPGGQQEGSTQDLSASDLASLNAGPNTQNVDVTALLNRNDYPQSYVLKNSTNNVTMPAIGQTPFDNVQLVPNVGPINVTYQYKGKSQGSQTISSDALAKLGDAAGTSNVNITGLLSGYPASYKLAGDTKVTVPSKSTPLNINVDLTPNIGDTRVDYNYNGQRGATTFSASDLVGFNKAAGSNVDVYSKLGNLPAGYQLDQSRASDTLPALGQTNTINVSVKPIQETDTINYVYDDNGTPRNEGSNRPSGDDSATGLPDSSFKITNTPTGLHQGFNVVTPSQSIPYDGNGHTVDVTPQTTSVNVTYKSGDSSVGGHTYTGPVSATGLSSDQFSIGSKPAGLPNGYNVDNSSQNISYSSQNADVPVTPEKLRVPFMFETDAGTPVMSGLTSANPLTVNSSSDLQISSTDLTNLKDKWYHLEDQNNSVKVTPSDLNSDGQYVADPQVIKVTPRTITVPVQYMYNSHNAGNVNLTGTMNQPVNVLDNSLPAGYQLGSNPDLTNGYRITPDQTDVNTGKTGLVTVNVTPKQLTDTIIYRLNGNPDNSIGSQYRPTGDDDQTQLVSSEFTLGRHPQGLPSGYYVQSPSTDLQYDGQTHYVNVAADQMKVPYRIAKSDKTSSDLMTSRTSSSFTTGQSAQALFDLANVNNQLHAQGYRLSNDTNVNYALTGSDVNDNNGGADTFNNSKEPSFTAHAINFNVPIQFEDIDNRNNTVTNGNNAEASAKINQVNDLQAQIQSKLPTDYQLDSNPSLSTFRFDTNDIQTGNQLKNPVTVFIKPISHNDKLTFVYNDHTYGNSDVVTGPETGPEDNFKVNSVTNGKIPAGFQLKSGQGDRSLQYSTSANQIQVTPVQTFAHVNYVYADQDDRTVATANLTGDNYATGLGDSHFKIGDKIGDSSLNFPAGWKLSNPDQVIKYDGGNYNVEITPVTENDMITFKDANGHPIGRSFTKSGNDYRTGVDGSFNVNTLTAPQGYYLSSTGTVNYDDQPHTINVKPDSDILVPFQLSDGQTGNVLVSNQDSTNKFTVTEPNQVHFNASIVPKGYRLASSNNYSYTVTPSDVTNDKFNRDPLKFQVTPITYTLPVTYEYDNANDDDPSFSKPTTLNVDSTFNLNDYIHNNVPTNYRIQSEPDVTSWKLLDHIPASGTTLSPITVRIKPVQQKATVNYTYESANRNAAPVDLGTGDTSALSLPSSSFEIGNQPNGLPNGYRVPNPAQKINYNGQTQTVDVAPIQKTDTVDFIYTDGNHVQHQEGSFTKAGDDSATGLSTSSFIMASNHPNLHPGFNLAKPNQSIPFDGITHRVAVTPQSVTLTVDYMNGTHNVGSDQFTGHEEATQLNDDQFTLGSRPTGLWHGYHVTHPSQPIYYNDKTSDASVTAENFSVPYRIVASDNHGKALNSGTSTNQVTVDTVNDHLSLPASVEGDLYGQGYKLPDSTNFNLSHEDITKSDRFDATKTPSFVASAIGFTLPIKFEDVNDGNAVVTNDYSIPNVKINQQNDVQNDVSTHLPNEYKLANNSGNPDLTQYTFNSNQIAADNKLKPLVVYIKPQLHSDTVKFMYDGIQRGNSAKVSGPEAGVEDAFTVNDKVANEVPSGYQLSSGQGDRTLRYSNSSDRVQITPVQKHAHIKYVYDDNGTQLPEGTDNPQGNDVATGLVDSKFEIGKNPSELHTGFNVEPAERNSVIRYDDQSYIINVVPQTTSITVTYKSGEKSVGSHQFTGPVASTQLNSDQFKIGSRPNGLWNGYYVSNPNQEISYSNGSAVVNVIPESFKVPFKVETGNGYQLAAGVSTNPITVDHQDRLNVPASVTNALYAQGYVLSTPLNFNLTHNDVTDDNQFKSAAAPKYKAALNQMTIPVELDYRGDQKTTFNVSDQTIKSVNNLLTMARPYLPYGYRISRNQGALSSYQIMPDNIKANNRTEPVKIQLSLIQNTDNVTYQNNDEPVSGGESSVRGNEISDFAPANLTLPNGYQLARGNANDYSYNGQPVTIKVTPVQKTDSLKYTYNDQQIGDVANVTGNDVTTGLASGRFTVGTNPQGLPAGWQVASNEAGQTLPYDGKPHLINVTPQQRIDTINFMVAGDSTPVSTTHRSGNDYRTVNGSFTVGSLAIPQGYHLVTTSGVIPYDGRDHSVDITPDQVRVPFQIVDGQNGHVIVSDQTSNVLTVGRTGTVDFDLNSTLRHKGYRLDASNHYADALRPSDVNAKGQFIKAPLSFRADPIDFELPIRFEYSNSKDGNPSFNDSKMLNVDMPFDLNSYLKVKVPADYTVASGQNFKDWNLSDHLPMNGNQLRPLMIQIRPKQRSAKVEYFNSNSAVDQIINLGRGNTSSLGLSDTHFKIGTDPYGLPTGYQIEDPAQVISYDDMIQRVNVVPDSETVPIVYIDQNGQTAGTAVYHGHYHDQVTVFNLGEDTVNSTLPKGYVIQSDQNNTKTLGTLNGPVSVNVIGKQVIVPVEFINQRNGKPVGSSDDLTTRIGDTVTMPQAPVDYKKVKMDSSRYVAVGNDFRTDGVKKRAVRLAVVPMAVTPARHVTPNHKSGSTPVVPSHHSNAAPSHLTPSHSGSTAVVPNHQSGNTSVSPTHSASITPVSPVNSSGSTVSGSSSSSSAASNHASSGNVMPPNHHSNSVPVTPSHTSTSTSSASVSSSTSSSVNSASSQTSLPSNSVSNGSSSASMRPASSNSLSSNSSQSNDQTSDSGSQSAVAPITPVGPITPASITSYVDNNTVTSSSVSSQEFTTAVKSVASSSAQMINYRTSQPVHRAITFHKTGFINLTRDVKLRLRDHHVVTLKAHDVTLKVMKYVKANNKRWLIVKYHGQIGKILDNQKAVRAAYQKPARDFNARAVRSLWIYDSKRFNKRHAVKLLKPGTKFHVKRTVSFGGVTRLYLGHGHYVTGNDDYVNKGLESNPKRISHINFTRPVKLNLNGHTRIIQPRRDTLTVRKVDKRHGKTNVQVEYHGHLAWLHGTYGIRNAYYQTSRRDFVIKVLRPVHLYNSIHFTRDHRLKMIAAGQKLFIDRTVNYNGITRLKLSTGYYVTGNNDFVKII